MHGAVWRHQSAVLLPFMIEALASMFWAVTLAGTFAALIGFWLADGDFRAVQFSFWSLQAFTMALFMAQSISAWILDRHYARQPLWLLLLSPLYPFYFLSVILPSAITGWSRGLFSEQSGRWERTERV